MRCALNKGIAIGPILMVIALIAVIGGMMSAGLGSFGSNATIDRIKTDVRGQSNLIRSKIQECYMITMGNEGFGWPAGNGTLVKNLDCPGDAAGAKNLWTGARPTALPPVTPGFQDWVYRNYTGGRCISITPTGTPDMAIKDGLTNVATQFNNNERHLDTGGDWTLSIWLTPMTTPVKCGT